MRSDHVPRVSVVVPVFNGLHQLPHLLEALRNQTLPEEETELLFVDNGSSDGSAEWLVAHARPGEVLFRHDRRGPAAARNLALEAARSDRLAFTDVDCLPHRDWLERGLAALEACPRAAGHIALTMDEPSSFVQRLDASRFLRQERYVEEGFGATANLFVRRSVFEEVGPFDERLYSNEDHELGQRAQRAGFDIRFASDAIVDHPCRKTVHALLSKAERVGFGVGQSFRIKGLDLAAFTNRARDRLSLSTRRSAGPRRKTSERLFLSAGHLTMAAFTLAGCARGYLSTPDPR